MTEIVVGGCYKISELIYCWDFLESDNKKPASSTSALVMKRQKI